MFSTRAIERKTPVAYTDVPKVQIVNQLGSRDLPMVLNVTPSVYATQTGGGAGDARINVRGFDQRNIAIMINGVPVNDMENGWVYWSNWDGVGDASASIQLQRGLSAVNLATPSVGGTMNVITDPSAMSRGLSYKQEFGSGKFLKETFTFTSGEMNNKFSFLASLVRKTGDGIYTGGLSPVKLPRRPGPTRGPTISPAPSRSTPRTASSFLPSAPHSATGRIGTCSTSGLWTRISPRVWTIMTRLLLAAFPEAGREWSPNVNVITVPYNGKQYTSSGPGGGSFTRHAGNYINDIENYFHKPQVNLNWYSYFGNGLTLSTVGYYSGGAGGGTGTYGSLRYDYRYTQRFPDWDATVLRNQGSADGSSYGILRNSVNNQWTIGAISKLRKEFKGGVTGEVGLDWRTAQIEHYREVRDLLGGQFYNDCKTASSCSSDFWTGTQGKTQRLGDRINYNNQNSVDWFGAYAQAEKSSQMGSVYGMVGWAMNSYTFEDFFADDPGKSGLQTLILESGRIHGFQVKGGASRNLTDVFSLFANAGYVSKVPIFDGVIDDNNGVLNEDPKNEKFTAIEGGMNFRSLDRSATFEISAYYTKWSDRTRTVYDPNLFGQDQGGIVNVLGLDQRHMGVEAQVAYQPNEFLKFDGAASIGNWKYLNNVVGQYKPEDQATPTVTDTLFIADLKVADAPQSQLAYAVSVFPVEGLYFRAQGRTYWNYYAQYNPIDRTNRSEAGIQSWKTPGYTVVDLHASYRLNDLIPVWRGGDVRLFLNAYNLLDKVYISDAVDNSSYNAFGNKAHKADDAEVFLGQPRFFNLGFEVKF